MYVPRDRAETGTLIPNAAEADAFWAYVQQDKYLRSRQGQYTEPNGALFPWVHTVDARLLQDFSVRTGTRRHTLQFSVDMLNFTNFLNPNWGIRQRLFVNNAAPLRYTSMTTAGVPQFALNRVNNNFPTETFEPGLTVASTWGMQLGLRYIF
jgi:hypothetical protein